MTTEEALKIFTNEEIDNLTSENLKTRKKEFLLEFQLTDLPVVTFNGHSLDKNAVIEIFEYLSISLEKHLEKHKNSIIDTFLASGNITYLLNNGIGNRIVKGIVTLPEKREKLLVKLSEVIADTLMTPSDDREELLRQIQNLTNSLPLDYEEKAFSASFRYLRNEVESIKTRYDNPFYDNFSLKLEPELQTMVDVRFLKLFQLLPKKFQFLAYEYSLWCYDFVIKLVKNREANFSKYPIDSLLVIRNAALIASEYYDEDANLSLSSHITTLLKNPAKLVKNDKLRFKNKASQKRNRNNTGTSPWSIIGFIALALISIVQVSKLVNRPSKSTSTYYQPDRDLFLPKKPSVPKFIHDALPDTSFKFIGFDGRRMSYVKSDVRFEGDTDLIKDVVLAIAKPNPFNKNFMITGDFEEIQNFRIEDLNGNIIYKSDEPYIKETVINLPPLENGTYLIRGYTDNGQVLTELIRENKKR